MHNKAFSKLLEQLKILTPSQKDKLQSTLHKSSESEKVSVVIDTVKDCPYCSSKSFQKWGVRSNLQRYRCNQCYKTFNALTGTPLSRLRHKEVWLDFIEDLTQSKSIRESAKHCGVDKSTTFGWRHRMLNNLNV